MFFCRMLDNCCYSRGPTSVTRVVVTKSRELIGTMQAKARLRVDGLRPYLFFRNYPVDGRWEFQKRYLRGPARDGEQNDYRLIHGDRFQSPVR